MNRTSARTALTTAGIGMAMLLTACGPGGAGSAATPEAPLSTGTVPPQSSSAADTSSGTSATASSKSARPTAAKTTKPSAQQHTSSTRASATKSTATTKATKPPAAAPNSAGDKPVALCTVEQLRISVGGGNADPQGAHRSLRFTNTSNSVCKLTGAPGVSYVAGNDGHQVGPPAKRIVGHQPIVLIPNATASAGLFISSAPHKSACAKATVRGLRVYPPDSYQAAFVPMTEVTCASAKLGPYLKVGPILPGPNNTV